MKRLALLVLTASLGACAVGPNYRAPILDTASAFRNAPQSQADQTVDASWWRAFNDPVLDALEDEALSQNLDVAIAVARVLQARAAAGAATAALLPAGELDPRAASTRSSIANSNKALAAYFPNYQRDGSLYDVTVGASWEIDLFGGLRRGREAARAELEAAAAGVTGTRLTITADVADTYVQVRTFQARLAVTAREVEIGANLVDLVRLRFEAGQAARRELDVAEATLAQTRAGQAALRLGLEAQLNALAVLTGRSTEAERGALEAPGTIPASPRFDARRPGNLLRRRPDLIAAERRLAAADARIGAAIADYYPKITLQGLAGYESVSTSDLFTGKAAESQGALGIRWRLFDFGRVDAEVKAAKGRAAEALAAYRQAVLRAGQDVENALEARQEREVQASELRRAAASLERARAAAQDAYAAGQISLIEVIDAERQHLTTQDQALSADADTTRAAIALVRALGG